MFYCQSHLLPLSFLQFAFHYLVHFISLLLRSDVPLFNKIRLNKYVRLGSGRYLSSSATLLPTVDCLKSELHHDVLVHMPRVGQLSPRIELMLAHASRYQSNAQHTADYTWWLNFILLRAPEANNYCFDHVTLRLMSTADNRIQKYLK